MATKIFRMNHLTFKACLPRLFAAGLLVALACLPFQRVRAAATRLYVKSDGLTTGTCQGN